MQIVTITCCEPGCGYSPFPMEQGFYNRAQETHEWWTCPTGHKQHFVGESDKDRQHRLEVERLERRIADWEGAYNRVSAESRRCPWPTCRDYVYASRDSMFEHMRRIHGMPLLAAVREAS